MAKDDWLTEFGLLVLIGLVFVASLPWELRNLIRGSAK